MPTIPLHPTNFPNLFDHFLAHLEGDDIKTMRFVSHDVKAVVDRFGAMELILPSHGQLTACPRGWYEAPLASIPRLPCAFLIVHKTTLPYDLRVVEWFAGGKLDNDLDYTYDIWDAADYVAVSGADIEGAGNDARLVQISVVSALPKDNGDKPFLPMVHSVIVNPHNSVGHILTTLIRAAKLDVRVCLFKNGTRLAESVKVW